MLPFLLMKYAFLDTCAFEGANRQGSGWSEHQSWTQETHGAHLSALRLDPRPICESQPSCTDLELVVSHILSLRNHILRQGTETHFFSCVSVSIIFRACQSKVGGMNDGGQAGGLNGLKKGDMLVPMLEKVPNKNELWWKLCYGHYCYPSKICCSSFFLLLTSSFLIQITVRRSGQERIEPITASSAVREQFTRCSRQYWWQHWPNAQGLKMKRIESSCAMVLFFFWFCLQTSKANFMCTTKHRCYTQWQCKWTSWSV